MAAKRKRKAAKPAKKGTAKKKAPKEAKEIKPGPPVESVVALVTGLVLVVAILMLDYARGKNYGEGMLFKGSYAASEAEE